MQIPICPLCNGTDNEETFSERGWLTLLESLVGEYQGYLVDVNEDELKETITVAIAHKNAEVIVCFEKGGNDGTNEQS